MSAIKTQIIAILLHSHTSIYKQFYHYVNIKKPEAYINIKSNVLYVKKFIKTKRTKTFW